MAATEREILNDILREFASKPWCRLWKNHTGRALTPDGKRVIAFGLVGSADLTGILEGGRRLEIEVKKPGRYQTKQQRAFGSMIRKLGGVYIVARSVQDVYDGLEEHGYTVS